jgi:hypothetical protein
MSSKNQSFVQLFNLQVLYIGWRSACRYHCIWKVVATCISCSELGTADWADGAGPTAPQLCRKRSNLPASPGQRRLLPVGEASLEGFNSD